MSLKIKLISCITIAAAVFALGRYSVDPPTVASTVNRVTTTDLDQDKDTHKKTVIVKAPSGIETTTITEDTVTDTKEHQDDVLKSATTVTPQKRIALNLSVLSGVQPFVGLKPVYGVSVSKEVVGPVTAGLWGLSDGTVGISVGLDF